jgi:two-component system cell cycle sensor histidine kinase/response regulator CckA
VTARVELEEKLRHTATMDAIGTLAAGIAHDFNNYLTVLALQVESARGGRRALGPSDLGKMAGAIDRCAGLVRQLLAFARQSPFRPQLLDLAERVSAVVEMFERLTGPEIEVSVSGVGPLPVDGDGAQLDAVFMNLLVNARDAMPSGGRILLTMSAVAGQAVVRLTDTGVGIAPEIRARIFEPYFTTKQAGRGVGLGLAAAYGTVKQHRGEITVASEPGAGTTFEVRLPLADGRATEVAPPAPPSRPARILLVEDLPMVRDAIERMLIDEGHQVTTAGDGEAALAKLRAGAVVDVVLSDIVMPRLTGTALARRLAEERPGLPVILMSGHAGGEESPALRIDKPFSIEQLRDALARARSRG